VRHGPNFRQEPGTLLVLSVLFTNYCSFVLSGNAQAQNAPTNVGVTTSANPAYPLKASVSNRYLVDQNEVPFLLVGDSPQALIGNLSPIEAEFFMQNRQRYGINALWINLLCNDGTGCNADGTTFDGIAPFITPNDLSTPNPGYERADSIINLAAAHGMVVILDPIETIGFSLGI
jgi:hypothetical protein